MTSSPFSSFCRDKSVDVKMTYSGIIVCTSSTYLFITEYGWKAAW